MVVCHICNSQYVTFNCPKCLKYACNDHYTDDHGILCSSCREKKLLEMAQQKALLEAEEARRRKEQEAAEARKKKEFEDERNNASCHKCGKRHRKTELRKCNVCGKWTCKDHGFFHGAIAVCGDPNCEGALPEDVRKERAKCYKCGSKGTLYTCKYCGKLFCYNHQYVLKESDHDYLQYCSESCRRNEQLRWKAEFDRRAEEELNKATCHKCHRTNRETPLHRCAGCRNWYCKEHCKPGGYCSRGCERPW